MHLANNWNAFKNSHCSCEPETNVVHIGVKNRQHKFELSVAIKNLHRGRFVEFLSTCEGVHWLACIKIYSRCNLHLKWVQALNVSELSWVVVVPIALQISFKYLSNITIHSMLHLLIIQVCQLKQLSAPLWTHPIAYAHIANTCRNTPNTPSASLWLELIVFSALQYRCGLIDQSFDHNSKAVQM